MDSARRTVKNNGKKLFPATEQKWENAFCTSSKVAKEQASPYAAGRKLMFRTITARLQKKGDLFRGVLKRH